MWPDLVGRVSSSNSHDAVDLCGGPPTVPMFTLTQGTLGVR